MAEQANGADAPTPTVEQFELLVAERDELERRLVAALEAAELEVADDPDSKLTAALAAAQAEFPLIPKKKTGEVRGTTKDNKPYSYTYAYADLGDVLAAVRPVLARHGLAVSQTTNLDNVLVTELRHVGGGRLESLVALGQASSNPQAFGGALTYLRRYEVGTLLGVAPEEDTDARNVPVGTANTAPPAPAELPPWATDLTNGRLVELGARLKVLLGEDGARDAARTIKANLGGIPAIVLMTAGLLVDGMLAQHPDELVGRLVDEEQRRRDVKRKAELELAATGEQAARVEAEAAQAAAEAPDPAPAEEAPAPESDVETKPDSALEAARAKAAATPAGKTSPPDVSGLTADEAVTAYRGAGCVCPAPLEAAGDESKRVDECPIMGHGIPF